MRDPRSLSGKPWRDRWHWNNCDAVYLYWFASYAWARRYDAYWFVEYDVAWTGDPTDLFLRFAAAQPWTEFIGPNPLRPFKSWWHADKRTANFPVGNITHCLVQMVRIRRPLLERAIDNIERENATAYCEMRMPSLARNLSDLLQFPELFGPFDPFTKVKMRDYRGNDTRFYHRVKGE